MQLTQMLCLSYCFISFYFTTCIYKHEYQYLTISIPNYNCNKKIKELKSHCKQIQNPCCQLFCIAISRMEMVNLP